MSEPNISRPSIRNRMIGTISLSFLAMFVLIYTSYYLSMRNLLVERERDGAMQQLHLVDNVITSSVDYLLSTTSEWSSWDETYDFVLGRNPDYEMMRGDGVALSRHQLNLVAILDADKRVLTEQYYDEQSKPMDNPPELADVFSRLCDLVAADHLANGDQFNGVEGFYALDGEITLAYLCAMPVLPSDEQGEPAGTFIFGRFITQQGLDRLAKSAEVDFSIVRASKLMLIGDESRQLSSEGELFRTTEDRVTTYSLRRTIFDKDNLVVVIEQPRAFFLESHSIIIRVLLQISIIGLFILVMLVLWSQRLIVRPLRAISTEVNSVDMDALSGSLKTKNKNEELFQLIGAINALLKRVKVSHETIQRTNEIMNRHANYDSLTGLRNRFSTIEKLDNDIRRTSVLGGTIVVYYMDMNRFKYVNDTLGHSAGDSLIIRFADALRDEFGEDAFLARIGGDKFVAVLYDIDSREQQRQIVERICALLEKPFYIRNRDVSVSASIGSSMYPKDGLDGETLVKNAEVAMFKAKDMGDGMYVAYEQELHEALQRRIYFESKLRSAIGDGCKQFRAYFQPKLDLNTGMIKNCEALIRWAAPEGIISPGNFVPVAEESGLIVPLSWWMMRRCMEVGRTLAGQGIECSIAINVPAQVLLHERFLEYLVDMSEKSGFPLRKVDIEIVEASFVEDADAVNKVLHALHELGAEVSVDDFGTGYSSLSYLTKLAVDRIKIDRSFVMKIEEGEEDRAIINTIVVMAKSLNLKITAEGVETIEQYRYIRDVGCDEIQGYFISRPLPENDFIDFVTEWEPAEELK